MLFRYPMENVARGKHDLDRSLHRWMRNFGREEHQAVSRSTGVNPRRKRAAVDPQQSEGRKVAFAQSIGRV